MPEPISLKNRIVGLELHKGSELLPNPCNWRTHSNEQAGFLAGVIAEIGQAGALLAYHSQRNGGALTLIDGHLRQEHWLDATWPVLVTDLSDEEADYLLTVFDPLGAMARADSAKLRELTKYLDTQNETIRAILRHTRIDIRQQFAHITSDGELPAAAAHHNSGGQELKDYKAKSGLTNSPTDREKYPLAIVLDQRDYGRWLKWKELSGERSDTLALRALLDQATGGENQ